MFEGSVSSRKSSADIDREFEEAIQNITADQAPKPSHREQWEELSEDGADTNEEDIKTPDQKPLQPAQSSVLLARTQQNGRTSTMVRSIGRISARLAQIRKRTMLGDLAVNLVAEHHHITKHELFPSPDFEVADDGSQSQHDSLVGAQ